MAVATKKTCLACRYCYVEPDASYPVCGHPDSGVLGMYIHHATAVEGHCGPERSRFEQHPLRTPDGGFKDTQ